MPPPAPRGQRTLARRRMYRRRRLAVLGGCVVAVLAIVGIWHWATAGGPSHNPNDAAGTGRPASATSKSTTTTEPTTTTTTVDPGSLPQTDALPTVDAQFDSRMNALWQGIATNSTTAALPAFFPQSAYVQLKALPDPAEDWTDRLVGQYTEDIAASHQQLGPGAAKAKLQAVNVDESYAHWVPPGDCYNTIGYYEVPNSRLVYTEGGQTYSFGIASLISWRGEWYVVHLGAVIPSGSGGQVDDPETGPGAPAPSSTC